MMSHSRLGTEVTHPPAASPGRWSQRLPQPGTQSREDGGATGRAQDRGQAQHFTSGLEVSAAEPEFLRRKKINHFKRL